MNRLQPFNDQYLCYYNNRDEQIKINIVGTSVLSSEAMLLSGLLIISGMIVLANFKSS